MIFEEPKFEFIEMNFEQITTESFGTGGGTTCTGSSVDNGCHDFTAAGGYN